MAKVGTAAVTQAPWKVVVKQPDARSDERDVGPPSLHHNGLQHDRRHQSELSLNWDEHSSGGGLLQTKPVPADQPLLWGSPPCQPHSAGCNGAAGRQRSC